MNILDWNDVTGGMLVALTIIGIISYIIIFHILDSFPEHIQKKINYIKDNCLTSCKKDICLKATSLRGSNYYLNDNGGLSVLTYKEFRECLFTVWESVHVLFHVFLGYYYNIYISVGISVGFEIFEHKVYKCGSGLDIIYNFIGFLIGYGLRRYKLST